jgi:hypothetical protein
MFIDSPWLNLLCIAPIRAGGYAPAQQLASPAYPPHCLPGPPPFFYWTSSSACTQRILQCESTSSNTENKLKQADSQILSQTQIPSKEHAKTKNTAAQCFCPVSQHGDSEAELAFTGLGIVLAAILEQGRKNASDHLPSMLCT